MADPREPDTDNIIRAFDLKGGENKGVHRVRALLDKGDGGAVRGTVANAVLILAHDPPVARLFGYNEFVGQPMLMRAPPPAEDSALPLAGPYPRLYTPTDLALVLSYVQAAWSSKIQKGTLEDAILAAASANRFHPVRDWLSSLKWDGKRRLDTWLKIAFGAPGDEYHASVGAKFLIAAVRRIFEPGCKFDQLLVLEGNQGLGKSRACRALFGEWFADNLHHDVTSRDAPIGMTGLWGIELPEIQQVVRSEPEPVKAFLSRSVDTYIPRYGKTPISVPRQSVLIGTTNVDDWMRDVTGNRRFWPVRCAGADVEWLEVNRIQLWAEAVARNAQRESLWLDDDAVRVTAENEQQERMVLDVWADKVMDFLSSATSTTVSDVLSSALSIPFAQQNKGAEMRVGAILRGNGWAVKRERVGRRCRQVWRPKEAPELEF